MSLSKLFWLVAEPSSFLFLIWLVGVAFLWTRWVRIGRALVTLAALVSLAIAMLPIGVWALKPIEDRFPPLHSSPPGQMGSLCSGVLSTIM